jgi:hypothetical protein
MTRRPLGYEIGHVNARLRRDGRSRTVGFSEDEARPADVQALADGGYRSADALGE